MPRNLYKNPFIVNVFLILSMGKISKTFALMLTLTIIMSFLTLLIAKPVNANQGFSVTFSNNNSTTYINQPVELMAYVSGGTPPFTFQWITQFVPQ